MKVRVKFTKHGCLRFIGHLDMMRYFQKALRRCEIDIAFTQGFSPHPIMTFAAPLGVGLESDGEYMDFVLNFMESCDEIKEKLSRQMVDGVEILSVTVLPEKAKNAMASVAAAGYYLIFKDEASLPADWKPLLEKFLAKEDIPVEKQTKKNLMKINIRPAVYDFRAASYHGKNALYLKVNASSSGNIKPLMVLHAFFDDICIPLEDSNVKIIREDTYLNIGTEEQPEFVPMDAIGERM